jgi:hypothetical protein
VCAYNAMPIRMPTMATNAPASTSATGLLTNRCITTPSRDASELVTPWPGVEVVNSSSRPVVGTDHYVPISNNVRGVIVSLDEQKRPPFPCLRVAADRDEYVDDLPILVNLAVDVPPDAVAFLGTAA